VTQRLNLLAKEEGFEGVVVGWLLTEFQQVY